MRFPVLYENENRLLMLLTAFSFLNKLHINVLQMNTGQYNMNQISSALMKLPLFLITCPAAGDKVCDLFTVQCYAEWVVIKVAESKTNNKTAVTSRRSALSWEPENSSPSFEGRIRISQQ